MKKVLIFLSFVFVQYIAQAQSIKYVSQQGAGLLDGTSWANAYSGSMLQNAINTLSEAGGGQIWIAAGTYYPTQDTLKNSNPIDERTKTFALRNKVAVFGGFAGTEKAINDRSKSDKNADNKISAWEFTNETVLSGNIQKDADSSNNVYHVVFQKKSNLEGVLLDGFTVQEGNAAIQKWDAVYKIMRWNPSDEENNGGGIFINKGSVIRSVIQKNVGSNAGGGIIANNTIIDSCYIASNVCEAIGIIGSGAMGAGVFINETGTLSNSTITKNKGYGGAGVFINAGGNVVSCNIAYNKTGAAIRVYRAGSINNSNIVNNVGRVELAYTSLVSSTIAKNGSKAILTNSKILNSLITDEIDYGFDPKRYNSEMSIKYSIVRNLFRDSATNILLGNILAYDFVTTYGFVDTISYKLKGTSPAINAGMPNVGSLNQVSLDLYGNPRIQYGIIDIGSNEYYSHRFVTQTGAGNYSGNSWANALPGSSLTAATDLGAGEVWIKQGTYYINSKTNPMNNIILSGNEKIYGGFAGNETDINQRVKADIDNNKIIEAWEFATPTILKSDPQAANNAPDPDYEGLPYLVEGWGENANTLLDGLTISDYHQEANAQSLEGGAIRLGAGTITNCIITNNSTYPADQYNSVVNLIGSTHIDHCLIANNKSKVGGGLSLEGSSTASFCVIRNNTSYNSGGGVAMSGNSILENSTISNNINVGAPSDDNGGGVFLAGGTVRNCIITNNTSTGAATRGGGVFVQEATTNTIQNSIIVNNRVIGSDAYGHDIGIAQGVTMVNSIVGSSLFLRAINPSNVITHCILPDSVKSFGIENNFIFANQTSINALFKKPSTFTGNGFSIDSTQAIIATDWHLNTSQYFNKGFVSSTITYSDVDLAGNLRIEHDTIDVGPYELKINNPNQGSGLIVASQPVSGTVQMTWNKTNSDRYLLFVNENISGSASVELTNGLSYTSNKQYGLGSKSNNWSCVYNGTDTTITINGLLQGTSYKAMIITANGTTYPVYNDSAIDNVTIKSFITKREQTIQLTLPDTIQGVTDLIANVSTTSGLNIQLTSLASDIVNIQGTKITIIKEGTAIITATQSGNSLFFPATVKDTIVVKKAAQTITFSMNKTATYGDADIALNASCSSGLPIQFTTSDNNVATISNGWLSIKSAGTVTISAVQPGNNYFTSATTISYVLTINKATQKMSFGSLASKNFGDASFAITANASSGLPINLVSSNTAVLSLAGNIATINGGGTSIIKAFQVGNNNYFASDTISQTIVVAKKIQSILMDSISPLIYGVSDFAPVVKTESNEAVVLTSNNSSVATILNGKIHIVGVGSATITATQNGTVNYLSTSASKVIKVVKSQQIITFANLGIKTVTDTAFLLEASCSSGLPITYAINNATIIALKGDTVLLKSSGKVTVTASQLGNDKYEAAIPVSNTLTILPADQSIVFDALDTITYGSVSEIIPTVSASSSLPISLTSFNLSVAKIVNGKIVIVGAGSTVVAASQNGNLNFNQAAQVKQVLVVKKQHQTLKITPIPTLVYGSNDVSVIAESSSKLPITITSSESNSIQIVNNKLHILQAGNVAITISQIGNDNFEAIDSTILVNVSKATQTLSFSKIYDRTFGDGDILPTVRASSGLACTLTSSNNTIASIIDGIIHINGSGTVSITASQAGNENYLTAKDSSITFTIRKASQSIVFNALPEKTFGDKTFVLDGYSTSGLTLTYDIDKPSIANVVGNVVTIKSAGMFVITAKQAGNTNFAAAQNVSQMGTIAKRLQTITMSELDTIVFGDIAKMKPTVTSSEGLHIHLASSNESVAKIINDSIVITGAGTVLITATQVGNDTITPALSVTKVLVVKMQKQQLVNLNQLIKTIQFSSVDTKFTIATSAGLPLSIASETPNIIQIVNNNLHTVGTGIASIRISQNGTSGIAAIDTTILIVVTKAKQTINFPTIPIKKVGTIPFKLFATSSSGYPVSYTCSNPAVADVVENEVTIYGSGACTIIAHVEESNSFVAASDTTVLIVTALNTLKMPIYTLTRDTVIDLNKLVLTSDIVDFKYISGNHASAVVTGSMATINVVKSSTCWIGIDTLWFTATNKTVVGDVQLFGIKVRRIPLVEEIGLVTVDSTSSTHCIIAWERSQNAQIAGYIMYRGTGSVGKWDSIGYVSSTQRSLFVDSAVNVQKQAYQYAMVTVDVCGNRSAKSTVHTTMHLMTGVNLQNKPQLWWTPYEGADVSSYIIYRKNKTTGQLDSIASSILMSYTDIDAPAGTVDYRVGIRFANDINPDNLKSDSGPFSLSLSNMAESELTESTISKLNGIVLYPNPVRHSAMLTLPSIGSYLIDICNTLGQSVLKSIKVENSNSIELNVSQLSAGVYSIKVQGNTTVSTLQFVKE